MLIFIAFSDKCEHTSLILHQNLTSRSLTVIYYTEPIITETLFLCYLLFVRVFYPQFYNTDCFENIGVLHYVYIPNFDIIN